MDADLEFKFDPERMFIRFPRVVTTWALMQPARKAQRHRDRYNNVDTLLDLSDVEHFRISAEELRLSAGRQSAWDRTHPKARARVAIVANSPLTVGLARQFQSRRTSDTTEVEIFRRRQDAEAWLDKGRVKAPAEAS